jgi:hypothetical protein
MTVNKSSESRRKVLKSLAASSGAIVVGKSLPESWSRPIIDSVLLPAHALTSSCTTDFNLQDYFAGFLTVDTGQTCPDGQSDIFSDLAITNCLDCTTELVFTESGWADDFLEVDGAPVKGTGYGEGFPDNCGGPVSAYEVGFVVKTNIAPNEVTKINVRDIHPGGTSAGGTITLRCV